MAAKRTTTRRTAKTPPPAPAEPKNCETCAGTGTVASTVVVGRKRRAVGQQDGFCLDCFGSGTASS
ncbi:hypothetical protein ACIOHE_13745 [Streptomyces sp. NPDC087851]|uniref:hypothetical protein n=1 Tax=Streptomyces sp. NPDC087851 TaxID=3365810 RepID=UPI003810E51D